MGNESEQVTGHAFNTEDFVSWGLGPGGEGVLSPREAEVIRLRYETEGGELQTFEAIGHQLGVTRQRVQQLERSAYQKFRRWRPASLLSLLARKVDALALSDASKTVLRSRGIRDVGQLIGYSVEELVRQLRMSEGPLVAADVRNALEETGLALRPSYYPVDTIDALAIPLLALEALSTLGMTSVAELAGLTEHGLLARLHDLDLGIVREVREALGEIGLCFAGGPAATDAIPGKLVDLHLSGRACNALRRAGFRTVEGVVAGSMTYLTQVEMVTKLAPVTFVP
jgi:DNA-binding CsgD family transcriptional regulator